MDKTLTLTHLRQRIAHLGPLGLYRGRRHVSVQEVHVVLDSLYGGWVKTWSPGRPCSEQPSSLGFLF